MNFSQALEDVKAGMRVGRTGWNGRGMWISLQPPADGTDMDLPYIYMKTADGNLVPWIASQTDLLAEDWVAVN